jgi:hypothetical protein
MALSIPFSESKILPLFRTPSASDAFIRGMGLSQVCVTSSPMYPRVLRRVLKALKKAGFDTYTLDPVGFSVPTQVAPIEEITEQVEAKI